MRKELLYAIIAGISIGLIFAFGTWKISRAIKKDTPNVTVKKSTPSTKNSHSVSIDKLNNFDVVTESIVLSGLTTPDSNVIIMTAEADFGGKSNSAGEFGIEVNLPKGLSEIRVISIDNQNNISEVKILLVSETDNTDMTTAYVGTITDISSGNIQIKSGVGGILQMTVDENTVFINSLKKNAEVKEADLAIGDYIIAMGQPNSRKVLDAKKVIITSPLAENKTELIAGRIETLTKTKITLLKIDNETEEIALPKKWVGPDIKELEVGQSIFIAGTRDDKSYTLRTIITPVE
jgi:hypothetical protein